MDFGIESGQPIRKFSLRKWCKVVIAFFLVMLVVLFLIILRVQTKYSDKIISSENLEPPNIALVFGAGLKAKGQPSAVLEDRVLTAIKLYQENKVGKFIMSGDEDQAEGHNEVEAMKNFALEQGLPEDAILLDGHGKSTYESCRRIKDEFGFTEIILITQKYHLHRALYLCNELGVNAQGIAAEDRGYANQLKFSIREWAASLHAWWQMIVN